MDSVAPECGETGLSTSSTPASPCTRSRRNNNAISTAAEAASNPLFSRPSIARSSACSHVSVVSTPNAIGTPVSPAACCMACATESEMYWKCGVAPRITHPKQTIASNRPVSAAALAACGNSNAPGTSNSSTPLSATRASASAARAPVANFAVMSSLNRATTMANRQLDASGSGATLGSDTRTRYFPLKSALRFSRNARVPSRMSSVLATRPNSVAS